MYFLSQPLCLNFLPQPVTLPEHKLTDCCCALSANSACVLLSVTLPVPFSLLLLLGLCIQNWVCLENGLLSIITTTVPVVPTVEKIYR